MIKRVSESYKHNFAIMAFGPFLKIIEAAFDLLIPLIMKTVIDLNSDKEPTGLSAFVRTFNPGGSHLGDALAGGIIILIMGIVGYVITMCSQYLAARASVNVGTEVRNSLYQILSKEGVTEVESLGKEFDPNYMTSISVVQMEDKADNEVVQVFQKGYMYKDRVLRPAMVVVNQLPEAKEEETQTDTE